MRDIKRIHPIMERLEKEWKKHPDLRLGQLILNVFSIHNGVDSSVYYMEDEDFIKSIEEAYKKK